MFKKVVFLLLVFTLDASAGPPLIIRGSRNEIIGRIYQHGSTMEFRGTYNQRVAQYKQLTPTIGQYYNHRGSPSGRIYGLPQSGSSLVPYSSAEHNRGFGKSGK